MSSSEEQPQPRKRGLPSIQQAREARVSGKSRWPSVKFWSYSALILAVGAILRWKWAQGDMESDRQKLMAMQRDVAQSEIGKRWTPFRDKVERWTMALANEPGAEVIDSEALKNWDFRDRAGVYLRLRVEDAKEIASIRKGARDSLRDAFTACLMRVPNPSAMAGRECKRTRDCPKGEFCNEVDHCSQAAQPFNLRVAYRTMHVLSDEWIREVQDASSDLRLRVFVAGFDDTLRDDLPLAAELLQRAQYFLLVLDESAPGFTPPPDAGAAAVAEAVQVTAHQARVGVWRIADEKLILRVRREAGGQLLGALPAVDAEVLEARQRQANSCALALAVRQAMGDNSGASVPPSMP
jgi:hypothetical protein